MELELEVESYHGMVYSDFELCIILNHYVDYFTSSTLSYLCHDQESDPGTSILTRWCPTIRLHGKFGAHAYVCSLKLRGVECNVPSCAASTFVARCNGQPRLF